MSAPCSNPCQKIICPVPDDLAEYNLQRPLPSLPPVPSRPPTPPTPPPPITGLVAYYKMDETTGSRLDVFGGNTLTEANGSLGSTTGIIGNAASFDVGGGPSYNLVRLISNGSSTPLFFTGSFSISAWFKADVMTNYFNMYAGTVNENNMMWGLGIGKGTNGFSVFSDSWSAQCDYPTDSNWHHVVFVFDLENQILIFYVDGSFEFSSPQSLVVVPTLPGSSFQMYYNQDPGNSAFGVDEMGFWRRVLTPAEVTQLYNGGAGLPYAAGIPPFI